MTSGTAARSGDVIWLALGHQVQVQLDPPAIHMARLPDTFKIVRGGACRTSIDAYQERGVAVGDASGVPLWRPRIGSTALGSFRVRPNRPCVNVASSRCSALLRLPGAFLLGDEVKKHVRRYQADHQQEGQNHGLAFG